MNQADREQELALTLKVRREALLALLTPEEQRAHRHWGSTPAGTFEDAARTLAESDSERAPGIRKALDEFQEAVNALWLVAHETDAPGLIAAEWRKKHRGYNWIDWDSLWAEALFQLRHFILRFEPGQGKLVRFAFRGVSQKLTEWAAQQGALEVPRAVARESHPNTVPFEDRKHGESCDYVSVVDEALDQESTEKEYM